MNVVLLNDTRADQNPGCQATVHALVRHLEAATRGTITTRPRGEGYEHFADMARDGRAQSPEAWHDGVRRLAAHAPLVDALSSADLVVANLEGTFHDHTVGALALGGALAVAHRMKKHVWAVNGTVASIDSWLLDAALGRCAHVAVREPRSVRWLARRGMQAAAAADCAFSLEGFFNRSATRDARSRGVLYTPGVLASMDDTRDTDAVLADLHTLTALGWRPVFLQMADGEWPVATRVREAGWHVEDVRNIAWNAFGCYLRQFALVVSGRYHVLIFAAMSGVPAIALPSNTFKIDGVLELLGGAIPLANGARALHDILSSGSLPPAIDRALIRRCQALAVANLPPTAATSQASARVAIVEGLDWIPERDLAATLLDLRRDGPDLFQTSIDTQPTTVTRDSFIPVRSLIDWWTLLREAGFEVDVTDESADGRMVLHVRKGPRAVALSRTRLDAWLGLVTHDIAPAQHGQADSSHIVFVVHDACDFDRVCIRAESLPAHAFTVLFAAGTGVAGCATIADSVRAWCRSRAIAFLRADTVDDLDWTAFPDDATLDSRPCAFTVTARNRGWRASDPVPAAAPIRVALFGASSCGRAAAMRLRGLPGVELSCFADNNREMWQQSLGGLPVLPPDVVFAQDAVDVIAVTSMHAHAIAQQIIAAGCGHKLLRDVAALELCSGEKAERPGSADERPRTWCVSPTPCEAPRPGARLRGRTRSAL